MYDPSRPTDMFNYPTPEMPVIEVFLIFTLIAVGFVVMFCVYPAFSMWLFSIDQHNRKRVSTGSSAVRRRKESSDYGYGYGKYRCVDDEAIYDEEVYDEVVYETEPPVKRAAKPPVEPPVEPPVKVTDSKIIEEAITGLSSLGFTKTEAKKVVNAVCNDCVFTDVEELIKSALDRSDV